MLLGEGLVTSDRQKWRNQRKILTPAFHFRILEDFLHIINEQSNVLIEKLDKLIPSSHLDENGNEWEEGGEGSGAEHAPVSPPVDVVPIVTQCMLDIICETAMGVKLNLQANSNHEYVHSLYNISRIFLVRMMRPWLYPNFTFNLSESGKVFNKYDGVFS